jgi:hypothetical protein
MRRRAVKKLDGIEAFGRPALDMQLTIGREQQHGGRQMQPEGQRM